MADSIFTKIINGDIPAHKIYEDEKTLAFLDLFPKSPGHTLVVPKIQIDRVYNLPDDYYLAVWNTVKKLSKHMENILEKRIFIKVIGTDIPHSHVHLLPQDENYTNDPTQASDADLAAMAARLKMP